MVSEGKYYIVEASALPEIFLKVAEAKRLLQSGEAATVNEAAQIAGISRSAFYKYRDSVLPLTNMMHGRVVTFQFLIQDKKGLLSSMLTLLAERKGNIQNINSITPSNGCALLTISAETKDLTVSLEELLQEFSEIPGVVKAEIVAG